MAVFGILAMTTTFGGILGLIPFGLGLSLHNDHDRRVGSNPHPKDVWVRVLLALLVPTILLQAMIEAPRDIRICVGMLSLLLHITMWVAGWRVAHTLRPKLRYKAKTS
jgi:hypothetical protein